MVNQRLCNRVAFTALLFMVSVLGACAAPPVSPPAGEGGGAPVCVPPQRPGVVATAYFGRNIDSHLGVTAKDWQRFLDREVTPRFPDGLTVSDAGGQYRDTANGRLIREPSKVLTLILPADGTEHAAGLARLGEVTDAYKRLFRQQSVLTVLTPACYAFR